MLKMSLIQVEASNPRLSRGHKLLAAVWDRPRVNVFVDTRRSPWPEPEVPNDGQRIFALSDMSAFAQFAGRDDAPRSSARG